MNPRPPRCRSISIFRRGFRRVKHAARRRTHDANLVVLVLTLLAGVAYSCRGEVRIRMISNQRRLGLAFARNTSFAMQSCLPRNGSAFARIRSASVMAWSSGDRPYCKVASWCRGGRGGGVPKSNQHYLARHTHDAPPPSAYRGSMHSGMVAKMQQSPIEPSPSLLGGIDSPENKVWHDPCLWFTELLPEGWCVGVCNPIAAALIASREEHLLNSTELLHPDEYQWGQKHFASDASRASYYLGRMALRSSINTLLKDDLENDMNTGNKAFYNQLCEQIQTTAIRKDYYGRPILPEIILGSISHKGKYAVGLSRFHASTWDDSVRVFDNGFRALDANAVQWREECPVLGDDDDENPESICSSDSSSARGIGIDIERVDDERSVKIQRKILTERERNDLGGLKVSTPQLLSSFLCSSA